MMTRILSREILPNGQMMTRFSPEGGGYLKEDGIMIQSGRKNEYREDKHMQAIELSAGIIEYEDTGGNGPILVLLYGLLMDGWRSVRFLMK